MNKPFEINQALREAMGIYDQVPCRVSADLRRHQREQDKLYPEENFDPLNEDHIGDCFESLEISKAVGRLLELGEQLDATEQSFGVSPHRFLEMCQPLLKELRAACKYEWEKR